MALNVKRLDRPFEVKAVDDRGTFAGYGSTFGNVDSYGDAVAPGAFKASLDAWKARGALPPLLWQHDMAEPIGVYTAMEEDAKGLRVEGRLLIDDDPLARRAWAHLKAGSLRGLSIGYMVAPGGSKWDEAAGILHLTAIDLWEVSIVTMPANEQAGVEDVKGATGSPREFERRLRDAGLSRSQAKALMGGGYKALVGERDAVDPGLEAAAKQLHSMIRALRG